MRWVHLSIAFCSTGGGGGGREGEDKLRSSFPRGDLGPKPRRDQRTGEPRSWKEEEEVLSLPQRWLSLHPWLQKGAGLYFQLSKLKPRGDT